jgi:AcrR family transcriptional regulator
MAKANVQTTRATRGPRRRELILAEAAKLFRERGFHAVGIDDIGAAAGISGPGVYRHFESKDAVLEALFQEAHNRLLEPAEQIVGEGLPPRSTLERLIRSHVRTVLDDPDVISVYFLEARHLSPEARLRRRRRERLYVEHWAATVSDLRDDLTEGYVQMAVQSVLWLINSYSFAHNALEPGTVEEVMTTMALAALTVPVPG